MKILMTGSEGFIGSLLRKRFAAEPWEIVGFEGDILSKHDREKYFYLGCQWDAVVHLAAIGSVPACEADPAMAFQVNSTGTFLIAEDIKKYSPRAQLIFSSTGQVYDLSGSLEKPLDEAHAVAPGNTYSKTKRAAELYIQDSFESFDGSYLILRIFNHSHMSQRPEFFMPSIYQQIIEKRKLGGEVVLEVGNMDVERDIGTVQDLAEAFFLMLNSQQHRREIYNLCSGVGKSLKVVVQEMATALSIDVKIKVIPERIRKEDPIKMIASCQKFRRDFKWTPLNSSDEKHLVKSFLAEIPSGGKP